MKNRTSILIIAIVICLNGCVSFGTIQHLNHKIEKRDDGGYTLIIDGDIQHMRPITAEGSFPKQELHYVIELKGKGKDWSYRNQPGFHYSYPDTIECKQKWDFGYAWVDQKNEYIYINFYSIKAPDSLRDSEINGKYKIQPANTADRLATPASR
jgi:hypothetical protein